MQGSRVAVALPIGAPDSELCQGATALVAELSPALSGTFLEIVVHSHAPDVRVPTWTDLLAQSPWKE